MRYNDALLKPERAEGRITYAIMSLEALYLEELASYFHHARAKIQE